MESKCLDGQRFNNGLGSECSWNIFIQESLSALKFFHCHLTDVKKVLNLCYTPDTVILQLVAPSLYNYMMSFKTSLLKLRGSMMNGWCMVYISIQVLTT